MESFHWSQHFTTGLEEVDAQHHHLIEIVNQFVALLAENEIRIEDVDCLYDRLAAYTVYHFRSEEKEMTESKVDPLHLDAHIESHNSFLEDVFSIYSGISHESLGKAKSLVKFLSYWIAYHILGEDQDMAKQIKAIKSGVDPREAYETLEQERIGAMQPLLEALNGLFDEVSVRNKELKQLNESLEEKVALRTKELSEANQHLEELSLTDVLTGLPNRRHAMQRLSSFWQESIQNDTPMVAMMIDADHFKEINDIYGHDAGDRVLVELAQTLKHFLRNDDVVCRLGGDEFLVICPDTDIEGGLHIAELTRNAVSKMRVPTGGEPWHGSISIGVASRTTEIKSYEELIKAADKGVYCAKEAGKNCVRATT